MAEIDQTLARIQNNKSVIGTLILDSTNRIIHRQFKNGNPEQYAQKLPPLIERAQSLVRDLDPTDDLTFLRVRTDKIEIMIWPDNEYLVVVVQSVIVVSDA